MSSSSSYLLKKRSVFCALFATTSFRKYEEEEDIYRLYFKPQNKTAILLQQMDLYTYAD